MKHPAVIPSLCAVFGFLLAWFVKPTPSSPAGEDSQNAGARPPANIPSSASGRDRPTAAKGSFDPTTHTEEGIPLPPELIQARAAMADTARNSLALKDQGYVQRLAELLGLTIEQQQSMQLLYQQKRDALNIYAPGKGIDPRRMLEEAEVIEKRFNDSLAGVLNSEQIAKLNAYRQQQTQNRTLASAQKEYADVLDKIDLSAEQQSSVLQALQQNATTTQNAFLDKTGLYAETFDAMGFGSVGDAMSVAATAQAALSQSNDPAATMQALVHARKQSSAQKIEALRSLLSPAQLAQYSALLEARDQAYYTAMAPLLPSPPPVELPEQ